MRAAWRRLGLLGPLVLAFSGCWSSRPHLKPDRPPEVYDLPARDDARVDRPLDYPKYVMGNDRIKAEQERDNAGAPGGPGKGPMTGRPGTIPAGF